MDGRFFQESTELLQPGFQLPLFHPREVVYPRQQCANFIIGFFGPRPKRCGRRPIVLRFRVRNQPYVIHPHVQSAADECNELAICFGSQLYQFGRFSPAIHDRQPATTYKTFERTIPIRKREYFTSGRPSPRDQGRLRRCFTGLLLLPLSACHPRPWYRSPWPLSWCSGECLDWRTDQPGS